MNWSLELIKMKDQSQRHMIEKYGGCFFQLRIL